MQKVLTIEDDYNLLKDITDFLRFNGYESYGTWLGYEGLNLYREISPELILLNLEMPDIHGFDIMRAIRAKDNKTRIIAITRTGDVFNEIMSFELLADDCIHKPIELSILASRIENALSHERIDNSFPYFEIDGLIIDFITRTVKLNDTCISFPTVEFGILALLTKNSGRVVEYKELLNQTYEGIHISDIGTLREEIRRIRLKIETDPKKPKFIMTEHRIGYRLNNIRILKIH